MTAESRAGGAGEEAEPLPLSALNQLTYCERRCALIHIDGLFPENAFTLEGRFIHEAADTPGYENKPGIRVVRALPLYSRRLGLSGKADIVEFSHGSGGVPMPCPVDYKRGRRRRWKNDDIQVCAQGLCLEEMLGVEVPRGAVFHAASRRRRDVDLTAQLRSATEAAVRRLHELIAAQQLPPARLTPRCDGCSLRGVCLPEAFSGRFGSAAVRRRLFQASEE